MPPKKISNKKELPNNAKILHPDGKWRDKKGRLTKKPLDEPTFKYDGRHYTKFKPRTLESKKKPAKPKAAKPSKPAKPVKPGKPKAKKRVTKQEPETISETVKARLFRPKNLQQLLGARNMRYSREIAMGIQEATTVEIENRMRIAHERLLEYGIDSDIKIAPSPDLTINAEFAILIDEVPIRDVFELIKEHLKFPATVYGSIGFRFLELGDKIKGNYLIVARGGDVLASKQRKTDAYQAVSGYMQTDRALRNIWKFGEEFLFKIYSRDSEHNRPKEIFIRMHWNPFVDDEGKPFVPDRQE